MHNIDLTDMYLFLLDLVSRHLHETNKLSLRDPVYLNSETLSIVMKSLSSFLLKVNLFGCILNEIL